MGRMRILIIDDEVSFTRLVKLSLEQTGAYEVRTEHEGARGLTAIREFQPDLILLDVIMPDIDGGAVASEIKAHKELKHIPIVFLTAAVSKEEAAAKSGIIAGHSFLAKPVSMRGIIAAIERHLGESPEPGGSGSGLNT